MLHLYKYQARSLDGKIIKGRFWANSKEEVVEFIRENRWYVTGINKTICWTDWKYYRLNGKKLSATEMAMICRQFAIMLRSGLSLVSSLLAIVEQIENPRIRRSFMMIYQRVCAGESFSHGVSMHLELFPELFLCMIEAGEFSGTLDRAFLYLADHYEREKKLRDKISSSLVYPFTVLFIAFLISFFIILYIMPNFEWLYLNMNTDLPESTKNLLYCATFVRENFWIGTIGMLILGLYCYIKNFSLRNTWIEILLKVPGVKKLVIKMMLGRVCRMLAMLLHAGVPILKALEIIQNNMQYAIMGKILKRVYRGVKSGNTMSESLREFTDIPTIFIQMVTVGENSGTLEVLLEKIADYYDDEITGVSEKISSLIEPMLILIVGCMVGGMVIILLQPILGIIVGGHI